VSSTDLPFPLRGVNYDTGTEFVAGEISRPVWNADDLTRDLTTIKHDLYCNAVNVYGTDLDRLVEATRVAADQGLVVSVQPRSIDVDQDLAKQFIFEVAAAVNEIARDGSGILLNVGCEMTIFTPGLVPGRNFRARMRNMSWAWAMSRRINRKLDALLGSIVSGARDVFDGPITYGAGTWEHVDWAPFDLAGMNLYRDRWNTKTYVQDLRALKSRGKPTLITEFGCATFEGAEKRGGGGWTIVDFDHDPRRIKGDYRRSEGTQAGHIAELLSLFREEKVAGTFVFDFVGAAFPHSPDPARDFDMASYGLVKVISAEGDSIQWERKEAFGTVAEIYRDW
jgi:hypothetical protein